MSASESGAVAQCLLCKREATIPPFEDTPDDWAMWIYRQPSGFKIVHHLCDRCDEAWNRLPNIDIMRALARHAPKPAPLFASVADCLSAALRALKQPPAPGEAGHDGPMHKWFGLSYASYLVLHRSVIQEMPEDWQQRLVALLDEARERLDCDELPTRFSVSPRGSDGRFQRDPYADYRRGPTPPRRQPPANTDSGRTRPAG